MIRPLGDKVLILRNVSEEKTPGGLILIDDTKEIRGDGKVIAIGDDVKKVNVGNTVYFDRFSLHPVTFEDQDYLITQEKYILAVIE